jgi:hypothetical protein
VLLNDVSLTIKASASASSARRTEKHALVYLIPRFLDPASGEIRIDQHNLRWVTLDSLRAQTAIVMQHNLVFHDTIANNIGCGDRVYAAADHRRAKVCQGASLHPEAAQGLRDDDRRAGASADAQPAIPHRAVARRSSRSALLIIEEPDARSRGDEGTAGRYVRAILPGRASIFCRTASRH